MNHTRDALQRQKLVVVVIVIVAAIWLFTPLGDRILTHRPEEPTQAR